MVARLFTLNHVYPLCINGSQRFLLPVIALFKTSKNIPKFPPLWAVVGIEIAPVKCRGSLISPMPVRSLRRPQRSRTGMLRAPEFVRFVV